MGFEWCLVVPVSQASLLACNSLGCEYIAGKSGSGSTVAVSGVFVVYLYEHGHTVQYSITAHAPTAASCSAAVKRVTLNGSDVVLSLVSKSPNSITFLFQMAVRAQVTNKVKQTPLTAALDHSVMSAEQQLIWKSLYCRSPTQKRMVLYPNCTTSYCNVSFNLPLTNHQCVDIE